MSDSRYQVRFALREIRVLGETRDLLNDRPKKIPKENSEKPPVTVSHVYAVPKHGRNPASRSDPEGSLVGSGSVKVLPRMALVTDFRKYGQKQRGYPHPSRLRVQIPFNPSRPSFDLVFL